MNQKFKEQIDPNGCIWRDQDGNLHFSVPEILRIMNIEDTPENRDVCRSMLDKMVQSIDPGADIVQQSACPECQTTDYHEPECSLGLAKKS